MSGIDFRGYQLSVKLMYCRRPAPCLVWSRWQRAKQSEKRMLRFAKWDKARKECHGGRHD